MNAFLASLCVATVLTLGADFLLGGPLFDNPNPVLDRSSSTVYSSPNVRLD